MAGNAVSAEPQWRASEYAWDSTGLKAAAKPKHRAASEEVRCQVRAEVRRPPFMQQKVRSRQQRAAAGLGQRWACWSIVQGPPLPLTLHCLSRAAGGGVHQ